MVFWISLIAIVLIGGGIWLGIAPLTALGCGLALTISIPVLYRALRHELTETLSPSQRNQLAAAIALVVALIALGHLFGFYGYLAKQSVNVNWEEVGSIADWFGALGQILIAVLAVYIAWQQYVISRDLTMEQNRLTTQQNVLTQQQTIDTYFQGISDLALDDRGFLEDWPQEQAFAAGRTAALLSSIDGAGKAKVLRFLSQSKLLTPLKRDRKLGKPIFDGDGGYAEDRLAGTRVIDLGVMLAGADLAHTDLRWTDLSDANLIRANLSGCDLVKANLSRTILFDARLDRADIKGTRLFYGSVTTASPRSRLELPNYETGAYTGAVVENAVFTNVQEMSEEQRQYCCAWCGEKSRRTIPGGCQDIPNKLGK
jgi:uncharacterized protein YjbI with pentapeptide repeats